MFELTLGNYITVSRLLVEDVSDRYMLPMLAYKLFMGFAVVRVISGVFLHETFKVASTDDDLMVVQKSRALAKFRAQMEKLFQAADRESSGAISRVELNSILRDQKTKT